MKKSDELLLKRIGGYTLVGKTLGKGAFARVELATHRLSNTKVSTRLYLSEYFILLFQLSETFVAFIYCRLFTQTRIVGYLQSVNGSKDETSPRFPRISKNRLNTSLPFTIFQIVRLPSFIFHFVYLCYSAFIILFVPIASKTANHPKPPETSRNHQQPPEIISNH